MYTDGYLGVLTLALILNGDYYLGSVLATTLTKLVLRYSKIVSEPGSANARRAEVSDL
jgi:coatomer subunit beta